MMTPASVLRWRDYVLREQRGALDRNATLVLNMRALIKGEVVLREFGADYYTFNEVVVNRVYGVVAEYLPTCETVIDLGANIGLASLFFATHYPACRLCAVEPDADNFNILNRNLKPLLASGRGQAIRAGLWNRDTDLVVEAPTADGEYNAFTVREATEADDDRKRMPGLTIQSILAASRFERVDLLKVDVEGAERSLFQGDLDWLERVRSIAIEFHDDSRAECRFDEIMKEHGFLLRSTGDHTVLAIRE